MQNKLNNTQNNNASLDNVSLKSIRRHKIYLSFFILIPFFLTLLLIVFININENSRLIIILSDIINILVKFLIPTLIAIAIYQLTKRTELKKGFNLYFASKKAYKKARTVIIIMYVIFFIVAGFVALSLIAFFR